MEGLLTAPVFWGTFTGETATTCETGKVRPIEGFRSMGRAKESPEEPWALEETGRVIHGIR
jgi:hypothetical protein